MTTSTDSGGHHSSNPTSNAGTPSKHRSYDDLTPMSNATIANHKVVNLTQHLKQSRVTRSLAANQICYENSETASSSSTGSSDSLNKTGLETSLKVAGLAKHEVSAVLANSAAQMLKEAAMDIENKVVVENDVVEVDSVVGSKDKRGILEEEMLEIHRLKSEMSIPHSHVSRKSSNDNQSTHSSQLSAGDSAAAYNYSKALNGGSFPDYIDCRYYVNSVKKCLFNKTC